MYELRFDPDAIEFMQKTEKVIAKRIWNKLMAVKSEPHRYFIRLTSRSDYKLRVGDYRIIADIDDAAKIIEITFICHRSKVYQNSNNNI